MAEKISYDKAKAELEKILDELEEGNVGVDQLSKLVKRAGELIKICKSKLRETDNELKGIFDNLGEEEQ